jgi:hypothetical protein
MKKILRIDDEDNKWSLGERLKKLLEEMDVFEGNEDWRYAKRGVLIIEFIEEPYIKET